MKPFAFELLDEFLNGRSAESLVRDYGIPADRLEIRLRAAILSRLRMTQGPQAVISPVSDAGQAVTFITDRRGGPIYRPCVSSRQKT